MALQFRCGHIKRFLLFQFIFEQDFKKKNTLYKYVPKPDICNCSPQARFLADFSPHKNCLTCDKMYYHFHKNVLTFHNKMYNHQHVQFLHSMLIFSTWQISGVIMSHVLSLTCTVHCTYSICIARFLLLLVLLLLPYK